MATIYFGLVLTLFFLSCCDSKNNLITKKAKCNGSGDDSACITINCDDDSCEDSNSADSEYHSDCDDCKPYDDNNDRIRRYKNRIRDMEPRLRKQWKKVKKLKEKLEDCLMRKYGDVYFNEHSEQYKLTKEPNGLHLCLLTDRGCDIYVSIDEERDRRLDTKLLRRLERKLHRLQKQKKYLEEEIERLTDLLEECEGREVTSKKPKVTPKTRTTTTTTTPRPKVKKYALRSKKVTWSEADRLCRAETPPKYLASITSQQDQDALGQARKDQGVESGQLWVGGKRDSDGKFFWKGAQDVAFSYTNWHSTEPSRWSDEDQNCMESSWQSNNYMWFVYECSDEYSYACEYYE